MRLSSMNTTVESLMLKTSIQHVSHKTWDHIPSLWARSHPRLLITMITIYIHHLSSCWSHCHSEKNAISAFTLLSSSTVLRFSIQMASTGPSRTIHVFWVLLLAARRQRTANMPSVQSPVAASMRPNICGAVIACQENHGTFQLGPFKPKYSILGRICYGRTPTLRQILASLSTTAFCYASVGEFETLQARHWLPFAHSSLHLTINTVIWWSELTLGFMRQMTVFWPNSVRAAARHSTIVVLPAPEGPTSIMPWRTRDVSYSWMHLLSQLGWGCKFLSTKTC